MQLLLVHKACIIVAFSLLDKNECLTNNGGCAHNCTNYNGTYGCSCASGYTLSDNGKSCTG